MENSISDRFYMIRNILYVVFIINVICGQLNTPSEERRIWLLKIICILETSYLTGYMTSRVKMLINVCLSSLSILIVISLFSVFVDNWIKEYIIHISIIQLIFNTQLMVISSGLNIFVFMYYNWKQLFNKDFP